MEDLRKLWGYEGKKVVINGGATGMGAAATQLLLDLGAEVYTCDIKEPKAPVKKYIYCDLSDIKSIDEAMKQIPDNIDRVFCCAGVPGPPWTAEQIVTTNFIGQRYFVESLLPRINKGGAIASIASNGGSGWRSSKPFPEFLAMSDFEKSVKWFVEHQNEVLSGTGNEAYSADENPALPAYAFSKQCLIIYAKLNAWKFMEKGIRINTISPGATNTPMWPLFVACYGEKMTKSGWGPIQRSATPEEQGFPLVFLNSDMASYINGQDLIIDAGFIGMLEGKPFSEGR